MSRNKPVQRKEKKEYHGFQAVIRDPRVIVAAVLVILSLCAIFIPIGDRDGMTNLKFGLDLEGGSWIQLEFQAEVVSVANAANINTVAESVGKTLGCNVIPIDNKTIEVQGVYTEDELRKAVEAAGATYVSYEKGVGSTTADTVKRILESKVNSLGTSDVKVNVMTNLGGTAQYVRVELAGVDIQTAQEIVGSQGLFEVRIVTTDGQTEHVLYGDAVTGVQNPKMDTSGVWGVSFSLTEDGAKALRDACIQYGATTNPKAHELQMYLDGEMVYSAPLSSDLAVSLSKTPIYSLMASTGTGDEGKEKAESLEIHLRAGALPVQVQIAGSGSTSAALGEYFKVICVIAALAALAAVAVMVYIRYREPSIVLPMVLTNISEIVILLGIAVFIQQLDLAAIAALIAVLGTGVDQLVIITDEVMHEGRVPSAVLYLKRLKRALVIIITSAATVIIAMFPLIIMDLSTLKGFAIVNILGILIGVIITRPAYGKIVMEIMATRKEKVSGKEE
ncbi:MAG TPA: preprotein translocase subunit SecD [Methanocorpusculum sp.]|nr:preprotein translocase subunit SecD [Methanocorpusculum sp.]